MNTKVKGCTSLVAKAFVNKQNTTLFDASVHTDGLWRGGRAKVVQVTRTGYEVSTQHN